MTYICGVLVSCSLHTMGLVHGATNASQTVHKPCWAPLSKGTLWRPRWKAKEAFTILLHAPVRQLVLSLCTTSDIPRGCNCLLIAPAPRDGDSNFALIALLLQVPSRLRKYSEPEHPPFSVVGGLNKDWPKAKIWHNLAKSCVLQVLARSPPNPVDHPTEPDQIREDCRRIQNGRWEKNGSATQMHLSWQHPPCLTAFSLTCTITIASQPLLLRILSVVWMALRFPPAIINVRTSSWSQQSCCLVAE